MTRTRRAGRKSRRGGDSPFGAPKKPSFLETLQGHGAALLVKAKKGFSTIGEGAKKEEKEVTTSVSGFGSKVGGSRRRRGGSAFARRLRKKRGTKRVRFHHPKKGSKSRTRKGRKDFTVKKSSRLFNRRKHRQSRSSRGIKRRPYHKRR
jgi:hypothetical protein